MENTFLHVSLWQSYMYNIVDMERNKIASSHAYFGRWVLKNKAGNYGASFLPVEFDPTLIWHEPSSVV